LVVGGSYKARWGGGVERFGLIQEGRELEKGRSQRRTGRKSQWRKVSKRDGRQKKEGNRFYCWGGRKNGGKS